MDEHVATKGILRSLEVAGDAAVERSLIGAINAHNVSLHQAAAGPVMSSGDVAITQGGCGPVMCSGDVTIRQGGCGPSIVHGNLSIEQGGTQSVIAAGEARLGDHAYVGVVLAPKVTVEAGAKVLLSTPQALAFGAGAGVAVALLSRLFRR